MLLTIHNLPPRTASDDVKQLIISKCGLRELILDNLVSEGGGMRVTVGVMEDEDAAILVRKINGIFFRGHQLYVENKRQKQESDQPYRTSVAQSTNQQYLPQGQGQGPSQATTYDYSQMQQMQDMAAWSTGQTVANYMFQAQPVAQAVPNAYMAYGQQQYPKPLMSLYTGTLNDYGQQGYNQTVTEQQTDDQQGYGSQQYNQQAYNLLGFREQTYNQQGSKAPGNEDLYARRSAPTQQNKTVPQWDVTQSDRNERRRPASPRAREHNQPAPKRTKWDQNDHSDRSFDQRDDRGSNSRGYQANRPNAAPSRWDRSSERRDDRRDRHDQTDHRDQNDWRGQMDHRDQTNRRDQQVWRDQTNGRNQSVVDRRNPTDRRDQAVRREHPERRDQPNRRDQPERRDQPVRRDHSGRREQPSRFQQPQKTNPDSKKPATQAQVVESKPYDMKYQKLKAMRLLMFETLRNLQVEDALKGPSVLKTALRKVIIARIDQLFDREFMEAESIAALYRNKYPERTDRTMFNDLKEKVLEVGNMTGTEMIEYATKFIVGGWTGAQRANTAKPPQNEAPGRSNPSPSQALDAPAPYKPIPYPFVNRKDFRQVIYRITNPVILDVTRNLNIPCAMEPSLFKTLIRNVISERLADMLKEKFIETDDALAHYRLKYPESEDALMYGKIMGKIAEKKLMNAYEIKVFAATFVVDPSPVEMTFIRSLQNNPPAKPPGSKSQDGGANKPAGNRFQDGGVNKPGGNKFQDGGANKPGGSRFQDGSSNKPASGSKVQMPPPGKIPSYPQGDKKLNQQLKKQSKKERLAMERYSTAPALQRAMDQEIIAVGRLIEKEFKSPRTDIEKAIYNRINKTECISECVKFITHHLSKRIANEGHKVARIYGYPHPSRTELQDYLARYNCSSLKKSVKNPFYVASFDSYETIDRLCAMKLIQLRPGINISVKHMDVGPVKPKYSQQHWKTRRKRYIESLIDHSRVNLLEKDWPQQEENEKIAREAQAKEESDDVILVEDEEIKIVDITGDNNDIVDKNDKNSEDKIDTNDDKNDSKDDSFLHEDFKVIDEVRESDNDDDQAKANNEDQDRGNDDYEKGNQIDDDWDQNGEDWGDATNDDNADGEENILIGDDNTDAENAAVDEVMMQDSAGDDDRNDNDKVVELDDDEDDDMGDEVAQNAEDIDIADVDWDNVDEDDLEDY